MPIVIQDFDQSPLSRKYIDQLNASLSFQTVSLQEGARSERALETGRARAAIIIPKHFDRDIRRGRNVEVQALIDAADANTANLMRGYIKAITRAFIVGIHPETADRSI